MKLDKKVIMVTGANGGIGSALVKSLLERGAAKIYAATRTADGALEITKLDPSRVVPVRLDITDPFQVADAASQYLDVDLLINNAGVNKGLSLCSEGAMQGVRDEMEVNFFGTYSMCREFAPVLSRRQGCMVNVCSILSLVSMPINGTYYATKAAAHSLVQGLRGELSAKGVRVVGVYPGPVDTPMTAGLEMDKATPKQVAQAILEGIEQGAEDIFPDPMSRETKKMFDQDWKQLEKRFAAAVAD